MLDVENNSTQRASITTAQDYDQETDIDTTHWPGKWLIKKQSNKALAWKSLYEQCVNHCSGLKGAYKTIETARSQFASN